VEDVGPALVEDDGAVALRRHVLPRVLGEEEEAAQAVGGEGSPEIPRDGRHPRAGGFFPGRLRPVVSVILGTSGQEEWSCSSRRCFCPNYLRRVRGRRGAGDFAVRGCLVGFADAGRAADNPVHRTNGNAETQMLFFSRRSNIRSMVRVDFLVIG